MNGALHRGLADDVGAPVSPLLLIIIAVAVVGLVLLAVFIWRFESRYDRRQPLHG